MSSTSTCFSFNNCAFCSLDCKTSVSFMQHCVNTHSFEVPELRALYNVRPLFFYGKKGLVSKFLEECANKAVIRTELILSILYEDPSPVSCLYSVEDERVYLKALSLAKYFRAEIKKATSAEDTQVLRNVFAERELFSLSTDIQETQNVSTNSRKAFMTPKEIDEISELRNNSSCKCEMKFVSSRMASIEEKSVDLMLTLRSYLDATNAPSTSKNLSGNIIECPESILSPSSEHTESEEFHVSHDEDFSDDLPGTSSDANERYREKGISSQPQMDYDDELSHSSATNFSESSTDEIPEEGNMMDSVLLTRLLISNWLTQGQPRIRENQIYHPVEDRLLKNDELCKAVARLILLHPEMIIDQNDFKAQLNSKWFQFVSSHTKAKVFKKLVKDGLLLKSKDLYFKIKSRNKFKKNLEYQLKLAEYGLRIVDYYQTE